MKKLNKKQEDFLIQISKNRNECIRVVGRRIYSTDVTCYTVRDLFLRYNLIYLEKRKNKEIPYLTQRGIKLVEKIYAKRIAEKFN